MLLSEWIEQQCKEQIDSINDACSGHISSFPEDEEEAKEARKKAVLVTWDEKGFYLQGKVYGEKIFLQYLLDCKRRKINDLQKRLQNQE